MHIFVSHANKLHPFRFVSNFISRTIVYVSLQGMYLNFIFLHVFNSTFNWHTFSINNLNNFLPVLSSFLSPMPLSSAHGEGANSYVATAVSPSAKKKVKIYIRLCLRPPSALQTTSNPVFHYEDPQAQALIQSVEATVRLFTENSILTPSIQASSIHLPHYIARPPSRQTALQLIPKPHPQPRIMIWTSRWRPMMRLAACRQFSMHIPRRIRSAYVSMPTQRKTTSAGCR